MHSIRYLGSLGAATTIVLAAGAAEPASSSAGRGVPAGIEHLARPQAQMPDGRIATPLAINDLPAAAHCPVPRHGPQFYAPRRPGYARTVALTFDDGPGKTTDRILHILHSYRAPATFFNIGENMAAQPAVLRKERRYGFLLGNHTWSHPDLT